MADVTELRMNIAALRRVDRYAIDIVVSATHVALYTFEDNEWEKTSIEGALFVYSRSGDPEHSMLIMNRLNTNNLLEPVTQGLELQLQEPFLLYRNSACHIYGIWFYDKDECVRVATKLNALVKDCNKVVGSEMAQNPKPSGSVDLFSMLSKAQDDYNSNQGVNSLTGLQAPRAPDVTSQSVMDFFAKAGVGTSQSSQFGAQNAPPPDVREGPLLLQRLMSNPVHSVEHIEKQQRSVTPQDTKKGKTNGFSDAHSSNSKHGSGFKLKILQDKAKPSPSIPIPYSTENGRNNLDFLVSSPKSSSPLATLLNQSLDMRPLSAPLNNAETPQKPALMPPTMFTSSVTKAETVLNNLLTPIKRPSEVVHPEPLTRNQLLQAFNYLIKHDAEFVTKLHEAYVKSFSELVS